MDRMAPTTATILENQDLFALQRRVGVDNVFVKELSIDLPCAISSLKPEGAGSRLGNRRRELSIGIRKIAQMDANLRPGGYRQPRIAWITSRSLPTSGCKLILMMGVPGLRTL